MKGHEPIIAMRRNGIAPKIVFVNDFPDVCAKDWHLHGDHATVSVDGDAVGVLDLRFLIGLMVSITGLYPVHYFTSRIRRETELLADQLVY